MITAAPHFRRFAVLFVLLVHVAVPIRAQDAPTATPDAPPTDAVAAAWDPLVAKYVMRAELDDIPLAVVDYKGLAADPAWPALLETLAASRAPEDRAARLAYWINAYNILCIKVVLTEYPVAGIRDIGSILKSVWKMDAGVADGAMRTLDEIEHQILRPMGDPRIHAAIVCASVSCPDLRAEAYTAEKLDAQLDEQMRDFMANEKKGAVAEDGGLVLRLSSIFDWFGDDFTTDGTALYFALQKYYPPAITSATSGKSKIKFLDYNWSLNDRARLEK